MSFLENAYFVSGIVLSAVGICGLRQIRYLKKDIKTKNERAAADKAIEACDRYTVSKKADSVTLAFLKDNIEISYKGSIGDFTKKSLSPEHLLPKNQRLAKHVLLWLDMLNEYEVIASFFVSGVADEKLGFKFIGKSFCRNTETNYDMIALLRSDSKSDHYSSIIELYKLWKPRISKEQMEEEKRALEIKLQDLKTEQIDPIGCKI